MTNQGQDPKESLRQSFAGKSADELADICSELLIHYVAQKQAPAISQLGMLPLPSNLREMEFTQLISWLKHNLSLPELQRFEVTKTGVSIRFGEQLIPMSSTSFAGTPDAPAVSGIVAPGEASPAPSTSAPSPIIPDNPQPDAQPAPTPMQTQGQESDDAGDLSERFSMLEID